jgi:hypothetical protein
MCEASGPSEAFRQLRKIAIFRGRPVTITASRGFGGVRLDQRLTLAYRCTNTLCCSRRLNGTVGLLQSLLAQ